MVLVFILLSAFYSEDSIIVLFHFVVDHLPRCRRCSGGGRMD